MDQLADKMKSVTENSTRVNDALKDRRSRVSELSSTHALLKKLQFLFELPSKLKECIGKEMCSSLRFKLFKLEMDLYYCSCSPPAAE